MTKEEGRSAMLDKDGAEEAAVETAAPGAPPVEPAEQRTADLAAGEPVSAGRSPEPEKKKPVTAIIVGVVILALIGIYGYRMWSFNLTHASTDDAQIAASTVDISPQISGVISQVLVADNQLVTKGQLLATIDDRPFQAQLLQAQANLDAAVAEAKNAGVSVNLTRQTGSAQIAQAEGVVGQAESGISAADSDIAKAQAGIANANAGKSTAIENVGAAESGVAGARAAVTRALAAASAAEAVVQSAIAQVNAADSNVVAAQSNATLAEKEALRYQSLARDGAVSQQEADAKNNAAQSAEAALTSARQQAAAARANQQQQQANLASAQASVTNARAALKQAGSQVSVAKSQVQAAAAGYQSALAQRKAASDEVQSALARKAQAEGQLQQAQTANTQVDASQASKLAALAKVEMAQAQVSQAKLNLSYTRIYSPYAGRVTKKNIDIGQLVSPSAPAMTIVEDSGVWVVANYKETQMDGIEKGDSADVEVDAYPGRTFKGHVDSIQAGTGSTFTLLPPDNASGNFTKVVQRIPIKIYFEPNQPGLENLTAGMSVTVVINLKGK